MPKIEKLQVGDIFCISPTQDSENLWEIIGDAESEQIYGEDRPTKYCRAKNKLGKTLLFPYEKEVLIVLTFEKTPMGKKFTTLNPNYKYMKVPEFRLSDGKYADAVGISANPDDLHAYRFSDDALVFLF